MKKQKIDDGIFRFVKFTDDYGNEYYGPITPFKAIPEIKDGKLIKLKVVSESFIECKNCACRKPNCGMCPYRYCSAKDDYDFVTKLCEDLRNKVITDRQFTIRYKKRFGVADNH